LAHLACISCAGLPSTTDFILPVEPGSTRFGNGTPHSSGMPGELQGVTCAFHPKQKAASEASGTIVPWGGGGTACRIPETGADPYKHVASG
jgi:hypothetical protein